MTAFHLLRRVVGVLCSASLVACQRDSTPVSPAAREIIGRGEERYTLLADLGATTSRRQPVDVLLVFDRTMSMRPVIRSATEQADRIMSTVGDMYANAWFGIATFADYDDGPSPWSLHQDLTGNRDAVVAGLKAIVHSDGGDAPEAYLRALHEARRVRWRAGARRYLLLFGDQRPHDPDPGPDGRLGTADDLHLASVVNALRRDSITVLSVHDQSRRVSSASRAAFQAYAAGTGGVSVSMKKAMDVVPLIQTSLRRVRQPAPGLVLAPPYASWIAPGPFTRVDTSLNLFRATILIDPPNETCRGVYRIPLVVLRDPRAAVPDTTGVSWVTVRIGFMAFPWRLPLLVIFLAGMASWWLHRLFRRHGGYVLHWRNWTGLRLLARVVPLAVLIGGILLIWRHAPGTLPPLTASPTSGADAKGPAASDTVTRHSTCRQVRSPTAKR